LSQRPFLVKKELLNFSCSDVLTKYKEKDMNIRQKFLCVIFLVAFMVASSIFAVPKPNQIKWNSSPYTFITSLYQGVLGRAPESSAVVRGWAGNITNNPNSRLWVFWKFVGSPEYRRRYPRGSYGKYNVYHKYTGSRTVLYAVSKRQPSGYNGHTKGPYSFGVCMALRNYLSTYFGRR
jgi:hypothetical protein